MTLHFFSFWLLLLFLLQKITPPTSGLLPFFLKGVVAAALLLLPVGGLSMNHWIMSVAMNLSIPLDGLLLFAILKDAFGWEWFSVRDWNSAWFFGAAASLLLYPAALGLGNKDPYSWGWNSSLFFIAVGVVTFFFICLKNRFAMLLMLALAAFLLAWQPSTNLWDYLIDPFYGAVALVMTMKILLRKKSATDF